MLCVIEISIKLVFENTDHIISHYNTFISLCLEILLYFSYTLLCEKLYNCSFVCHFYIIHVLLGRHITELGSHAFNALLKKEMLSVACTV